MKLTKIEWACIAALAVCLLLTGLIEEVPL
jgi:hypothetical protein